MASTLVAIPNNTPEGREVSRQVFGGFFAGMSREATAYRNALGGVRMRLATYRKRQEYAVAMRRFGGTDGAAEVVSWRAEVRKAVAKAREARAVLIARYPAPRPSEAPRMGAAA